MKSSHRRAACCRVELRSLSCLICVYLCSSVALLSAADVESRQLTHYVPQDALETVVRTEGWTEVPLAVKGGVPQRSRCHSNQYGCWYWLRAGPVGDCARPRGQSPRLLNVRQRERSRRRLASRSHVHSNP